MDVFFLFFETVIDFFKFKSQSKYENQIDEFKKLINDLEYKSKDALKNLELLLKEANSNIDALNKEK